MEELLRQILSKLQNIEADLIDLKAGQNQIKKALNLDAQPATEATIDELPEGDIPMITLDEVEDRLRKNEMLTGMTLDQYKQAIENGEIVNYSRSAISHWEMYERLKRELNREKSG
ncbi:hypothetical protein [Brevibacillus choshinensis]|uniref:hypothetical protein n=1 Tax=Brevibacillus choshinensis TaxID=54911 RepID=UPI002E1BB37B|nr:hypothetical protein [Brevibacillus choshinensis]